MAKHSFFSFFPLAGVERGSVECDSSSEQIVQGEDFAIPFSRSVSPFLPLFISWGRQKNSKHLFKVQVELVRLCHGPGLGSSA